GSRVVRSALAKSVPPTLRKAFPMNRLKSSLIALLLVAPPAMADGLQRNRVPAGVRWVAHLDVEALKSSTLYGVVHEEAGKNGANEMDAGLAQIRLEVGLDPTVDFKSVTVYGTSKSEKGCVALLTGNAKVDDALVKLKTEQNYRTTPVQSYMLHTWGDDHETWYAYVVHKDGADERVVLASQDSNELVRGISPPRAARSCSPPRPRTCSSSSG